MSNAAVLSFQLHQSHVSSRGCGAAQALAHTLPLHCAGVLFAAAQANQILGLAPGEIFVQRNVGNQAMHTDLNLMACLEYAVKSLKVRWAVLSTHVTDLHSSTSTHCMDAC
jgi:hypothetical protein